GRQALAGDQRLDRRRLRGLLRVLPLGPPERLPLRVDRAIPIPEDRRLFGGTPLARSIEDGQDGERDRIAVEARRPGRSAGREAEPAEVVLGVSAKREDDG